MLFRESPSARINEEDHWGKFKTQGAEIRSNLCRQMTLLRKRINHMAHRTSPYKSSNFLSEVVVLQILLHSLVTFLASLQVEKHMSV
jgi:hypothetical protein